MRKFILPIVLLAVVSCKSFDDKVQFSSYIDGDDQKVISSNQFSSRNLNIFSQDKKKTKVALLLPLSGKNENLGKALLNSAILSLFENDLDNNLELVVVDSKNREYEVKKAFDQIIEQDIKIVIGPVFSGQTKAIAEKAIDNEVTVISISNNRDLTGNIDASGGVFISGLILEAQIDKIVSYALENGMNGFAVIAPNNQYGISVASLFKKIVSDRDGKFVISELYAPSGRDLDRAVGRIVKAYSVPSDMAEGGGNFLDEDFQNDESIRTYPQVILIPESGKNLSTIVRLINQKNTDERKFQIVGTSQWDDISTLNDPDLVGSWFVAPTNKKFDGFEKIYYQSFGKIPPRISSIVYDNVKAISDLVASSNQEKISPISLVNYQSEYINGFEGIDGSFRFIPNGFVQRNLAVLEVGKGQFNIIEEPVSNFLLY